jgi:hypothetical protein
MLTFRTHPVNIKGKQKSGKPTCKKDFRFLSGGVNGSNREEVENQAEGIGTSDVMTKENTLR